MSDGTRIGIYGASGSGKSTLLNMLLRPVRHLVLFDYMPTRREHCGPENLTEITSLVELRDRIADGYGLGFRLWYRPPIEGQIEALHKLSLLLWSIQSRRYDEGKPIPPITFAVDEMSDPFPVTSLPNNLRGFYRMCKAGRHYRFNVVGATQRPAEVSTTFRGNLDTRFYLRLNEPADLDAVDKTAGREIRDMVAGMPNYHFIRQSEGQFTTGHTEL